MLTTGSVLQQQQAPKKWAIVPRTTRSLFWTTHLKRTANTLKKEKKPQSTKDPTKHVKTGGGRYLVASRVEPDHSGSPYNAS